MGRPVPSFRCVTSSSPARAAGPRSRKERHYRSIAKTNQLIYISRCERGVRALPAAGGRGPAAAAARARQGPVQRQGADRHPRARAVGRVAPSRPPQGVGAGRRGARRRLQLLPAVARGARTAARARCGRCCRRSSRRPRLRRWSRRTRRGCRKCCGCAARTSSTSAPTLATAVSWCRAAVGRRGRARWACCCRRSTSPTSGAARATSRSKRRAGRRHVTAVDRSTGVLARAKALAARKKLSNITWKKGELEKLPIDTGTMDVALLSQALHHASDPPRRWPKRRGS